jgi:plastocyanin
MPQPRVRVVALLTALLAMTLVAGACSSGDDDGSTPADTGSGEVVPGTAALGIADLAFEPSTLTVASGSSDVTITNADSTDHTFTLDDGSVDQAVGAGETVTVTVDVSSTVGFHCEIHSSMTGTLQVA